MLFLPSCWHREESGSDIMQRKRILILLGTYNGARFLREQLESIQRQTVSHWTLLIRDDGSQDETIEILDRFADQESRAIRLTDQHGRRGAVGNFGELMQRALDFSPDIIFFSDQDDIWSPIKVGEQMSRIEELEKAYGKETPILVHSDLEVVDATLHRVDRSFMHFQGLSHEADEPLRVLLVQNFVTGCATAINLALLRLAIPIPTTAIMHDWWLALCAASCGQLAYSSHPTVFYRQHGQNEIGAKGWWKLLNPFQTNFQKRWENGTQTFLQTLVQAKALHQRLRERESEARQNAAFAEQYAGCLGLRPLKRLNMLRHTGIRRQGILGQWAFCARLFLMPVQGKRQPYVSPV